MESPMIQTLFLESVKFSNFFSRVIQHTQMALLLWLNFEPPTNRLGGDFKEYLELFRQYHCPRKV